MILRRVLHYFGFGLPREPPDQLPHPSEKDPEGHAMWYALAIYSDRRLSARDIEDALLDAYEFTRPTFEVSIVQIRAETYSKLLDVIAVNQEHRR